MSSSDASASGDRRCCSLTKGREIAVATIKAADTADSELGSVDGPVGCSDS